MKRVLVVDDNKENLVMLRAILEEEYQVTLVPSGKLALEYLAKKQTDLVLLDVQMPDMDGMEVIQQMKQNADMSSVPVLFLTGVESADIEAECLKRGGDDYIRKPVDPIVLKRRMSRLLELYELRYNLEDSLREKSRQLNKMALSSILTIANTVDAKDEYTGGHSLRVAICSRDIAKNLGWSEEEIQNVYNVALLHDIGKIAVPDHVLCKPGRLDDEEFAIIKQHPSKGNDILKGIAILPHVQEGAHYHHERWDGRGYPEGLAGEDIPIYARIISLADSYDAMNSDRFYRKHLAKEKIISEIERCKGTQFDPQLAEVFLFMLRGGYEIDPEITRKELNSNNDETKDELLSVRFSKEIALEDGYDSLTGLFNRSYLNMKVGSRIMKDRCGALMVIDFDDFKRANDRYGHIEGDKILKRFAEDLRLEFSEDDIVSRMSGDQFAIFISGNPDKVAIRLKAQEIIDKVRRGKLASDYDGVLSISIGISICPKDGVTFEELYSSADKALYHGSQNGSSMYHFYGTEDENATIESTVEDMKLIKSVIEGQFETETGALSVEYGSFKNIYNYVYRYVDRNKSHVQVILFTINPAVGRQIELSILEQCMHNLDLAVVESLRKVDVGTRYSSNQYIVILTDTDAINGNMVANRVTDQYYRLSGRDTTVLKFDLETIEPIKQGE